MGKRMTKSRKNDTISAAGKNHILKQPEKSSRSEDCNWGGPLDGMKLEVGDMYEFFGN